MLALLACASPLACAAAPYLPQNGESYTLSSDGSRVEFFGPGMQSGGGLGIHKDDPRFSGWATGYKDLVYGEARGNPVAETWRTPENAFGKAQGKLDDEGVSDGWNVVCLGDGGSITLTFDKAICDGEGADFAIFENAFSEEFLELGYVEVSTDGVNFVRFPCFYTDSNYQGPFDNSSDPSYIYNLASKYQNGYGHGFDLAELAYAYDYAKNDGSAFSDEYRQHILDMFPLIDLNDINYVKISDVVGDGTYLDSAGNIIYDPDKCVGSPGFDLDGVGVINSVPEPAAFAAAFALAAFAAVSARRRRGASAL